MRGGESIRYLWLSLRIVCWWQEDRQQDESIVVERFASSSCKDWSGTTKRQRTISQKSCVPFHQCTEGRWQRHGAIGKSSREFHAGTQDFTWQAQTSLSKVAIPIATGFGATVEWLYAAIERISATAYIALQMNHSFTPISFYLYTRVILFINKESLYIRLGSIYMEEKKCIASSWNTWFDDNSRFTS